MNIIVAPTDFSNNGNNAVKFAANLAKEFHSKLILVHVNIKTNNNSEISESENELMPEAQEKLTTLSMHLEKVYNIESETHLLDGEDPAETIIQFAKKIQADMIIVGSTGGNLFKKLLMGSTSSKLIERSKYPVMCIPANAQYQPIKSIAFATDLKSDNINVALSLVTFAQHFNADISFLFVDDKDFIHDEKSIAEMTARIRNRVHYPKLSGYITKHTDIQKGIKNFLKQYDAQILAMYTHAGESTSLRFSKSVTASMSDQTEIPLLALKKETISLI